MSDVSLSASQTKVSRKTPGSNNTQNVALKQHPDPNPKPKVESHIWWKNKNYILEATLQQKPHASTNEQYRRYHILLTVLIFVSHQVDVSLHYPLRAVHAGLDAGLMYCCFYSSIQHDAML